MLPTNSQMKDDDDPENLPTFGGGFNDVDHDINNVQQALDPKGKQLDDEITKELAKLNLKTGSKNPEEKSPQIIAHDDSFSNLQAAI
jgi:hypothetical protein